MAAPAGGPRPRQGGARRPIVFPAHLTWQRAHDWLALAVEYARGRRPRARAGPRTPTVSEHNARLLLLDAAGGAVLNAAVVFNAVYAVRLGATNAEVGLLSSLPSLVAIVLTIPLGRYLERLGSLIPFTANVLLGHRLLYLLLALVPLAPEPVRPEILIAAIVLVSFPANAFGLAFNALFPDIVPENRRAVVVSWRNIILSVGALLLLPAAGYWLDVAAFPLNYQLMYAVAALWALLSVWALRRLRDAGPAPEARRAPPDWPRSPRQIWRVISSETGFVRIVAGTLVHGVGAWIAGPLYVLLFVREMGASDGWFGLFTTVASGAAALGYYLWQRGVARWGDRATLIWTIGLTGFYPLLVGLAPSLDVVMALGVINGGLTPGLNMSHFNTLLRVLPPDRRPTFLAIYNVTMHAGAFISPLLGVIVAGAVGVRPVLVVAGLLWASSGLLFWRFAPEPPATHPTTPATPPLPGAGDATGRMGEG